MAASEFETPALREYPIIPKLRKGVMAHSAPFEAKPDHQEKLGFPGELVDDWERKAVAKLGELVGKYRRQMFNLLH